MAAGGLGSDSVVTYKDGTTAPVRIGVREIVEIERHWKGEVVPAFESTMYGAWWGLGKPGDFDVWLDSVEALTEEKPLVDPSPPAVGDDS